MQSIFSLKANPYTTTHQAEKKLLDSMDQFLTLYNYVLYTFVEVVQYLEEDAELKASKYLPEDGDKEVNAKLLENSAFLFIQENSHLQSVFKKNHFRNNKERHVIQALYKAMNELDSYNQYLSNRLSDETDDLHIVRKIITHVILPNDVFQKNVEDHFIYYDDDFYYIYKLFVKILKKAERTSSPQTVIYKKDDYFNELADYAETLFHKTVDRDEQLKEQIDNYLKNWDANRLALVDIILLQMALCELLYFEKIPVKVTINEYIEISKTYSTPKSKDFINGVLDRMMKDLMKEGKIVKTGRGLKN